MTDHKADPAPLRWEFEGLGSQDPRDQTPPTDRPLTAGDVPLIGEALTQESAKLLRNGDVIHSIGTGQIIVNGPLLWGWDRFTFVSRPATRLAALASPPVSAEGLEECDTCGRLKVMGCRCDYASPPVSERERELASALEPFANLGVTSGPEDEPCSIPYRITRGSILRARRALTAQPAGEGK